jgi:antitoxin MazE
MYSNRRWRQLARTAAFWSLKRSSGCGRRPSLRIVLYRELEPDILMLYCISIRVDAMQVSKWGNSLAVRLPAAVVDALGLKEGDQIEIQLASKRSFDVAKAPGARELLARLRKFRGRLPATFKFDRLDANERR